jgi:hypothetical protein
MNSGAAGSRRPLRTIWSHAGGGTRGTRVYSGRAAGNRGSATRAAPAPAAPRLEHSACSLRLEAHQPGGEAKAWLLLRSDRHRGRAQIRPALAGTTGGWRMHRTTRPRPPLHRLAEDSDNRAGFFVVKKPQWPILTACPLSPRKPPGLRLEAPSSPCSHGRGGRTIQE